MTQEQIAEAEKDLPRLWNEALAEKPWSARIPAAIEKGEEHLVAAQLREVPCRITELELALAKALWAFWEDEYGWSDWTPPPALMAFTEKVERLT